MMSHNTAREPICYQLIYPQELVLQKKRYQLCSLELCLTLLPTAISGVCTFNRSQIILQSKVQLISVLPSTFLYNLVHLLDFSCLNETVTGSFYQSCYPLKVKSLLICRQKLRGDKQYVDYSSVAVLVFRQQIMLTSHHQHCSGGLIHRAVFLAAGSGACTRDCHISGVLHQRKCTTRACRVKPQPMWYVIPVGKNT